MNEMVTQKILQASLLLREHDLPVWIVQFARETYENPQPVQQLAVGTTVTWPAAFIVTDDGRSYAIVGTGDVSNTRQVGAYANVIGYVQDIRPELRKVLSELQPARVGVSYSLDDDSADNITHGMYRILRQSLEGTPFAERLVSADEVLIDLRARKLDVEIERIKAAITVTEEIFTEIEHMLRPGVSEREVAQRVHDLMHKRSVTSAWDAGYDPVVNFGPESPFGHTAPSGHITLEPGMLAHVDLGIKRSGYCSDLQRMWYILAEGEDAAPQSVQLPFDTVLSSISAGFGALRVGRPGWEVDSVARKVLVQAGYPEPEFSLGHQLGQTTHDGGALLGPRWARYGRRPELLLQPGNVFTLEYGVTSPLGQIGLEEDVLLTADGPTYLSTPQTALPCLRP